MGIASPAAEARPGFSRLDVTDPESVTGAIRDIRPDACVHLAGIAAPPEARWYSLFTGSASEDNLRMYHRAGYRRDRVQPEDPGVVRLGKAVRRRG